MKNRKWFFGGICILLIGSLGLIFFSLLILFGKIENLVYAWSSLWLMGIGFIVTGTNYPSTTIQENKVLFFGRFLSKMYIILGCCTLVAAGLLSPIVFRGF